MSQDPQAGSSNQQPGAADRGPIVRLSIMMFLQYAVWGAWLPVAALYLTSATGDGGLGFSGAQVGSIIGYAGSIGALLAPFIAGQLADRYFRTERVLGFLLLLGGGLQWIIASQTSYEAWLWLSILYSIVYMPTLALSNSAAFANLGDNQRDFPRVRLWGTIGWIAASWSFAMLWLQEDLQLAWMPPFLVGTDVADSTSQLAQSLRYSGMISIVYAIYCLIGLPATPPKRDAVQSLAFAKAFGMLRKRSFAVLVIVSLIISTIHQVYFLQAGPFLSAAGLADSEIGPAMSVGQFSEILAMALLALMLKRMGFRQLLFIGCLCYAMRYGIWSMVELPATVLVLSQVLHGFCYACFFAVAYIYVDRLAATDIRNSAQTVFGIIMLGGGPVLGGMLSGYLQEEFQQGESMQLANFSPLWGVLAAIAACVALISLVSFRDESHAVEA